MILVLDTNILISAIVFGGKPRTIFKSITIDKLAVGVTSKILLTELIDVLKTKFGYSPKELIKIKKIISKNFLIIEPKNIPKIISEDPFDNQVLAIANSASVDFIISGDNHLLKIKKYEKTPIITPHRFLDKIFTTIF